MCNMLFDEYMAIVMHTIIIIYTINVVHVLYVVYMIYAPETGPANLDRIK